MNVATQRNRPLHWKTIMAFVSAWLVLSQPSLVAADVFSARTFETNLTPIGEPNTDYCARSGVVATARNYGQVNAYANGGGANNCAGAVNVLPAGWIGVRVEGYRDGAFCGTSMWSYTSSATDNWQLYATLCTNPAGSQNFHSRSFINVYTGDAYTGAFTGPWSPVEAY